MSFFFLFFLITADAVGRCNSAFFRDANFILAKKKFKKKNEKKNKKHRKSVLKHCSIRDKRQIKWTKLIEIQ